MASRRGIRRDIRRSMRYYGFSRNQRRRLMRGYRRRLRRLH